MLKMNKTLMHTASGLEILLSKECVITLRIVFNSLSLPESSHVSIDCVLNVYEKWIRAICEIQRLLCKLALTNFKDSVCYKSIRTD